MNIKKTAALCLLTGSALWAVAHDGATGVVKERMDKMSAIGDANRTLSSIARGRSDFVLATVQEAAAIIAANSGDAFTTLFPEGSEGGDAKAEIWQNLDDFRALSTGLNAAALALGELSSEEEFAALYKEVSQGCSSCHRSYRVRR